MTKHATSSTSRHEAAKERFALHLSEMQRRSTEMDSAWGGVNGYIGYCTAYWARSLDAQSLVKEMIALRGVQLAAMRFLSDNPEGDSPEQHSLRLRMEELTSVTGVETWPAPLIVGDHPRRDERTVALHD